MVMSFCVVLSLSCHSAWRVLDFNGAARSLAGLYSGLPMARDCGGAAVFLDADSPFMIGLGLAERSGGHTAGTYRPGLEGTLGHSISADPSCRWVHRAFASSRGLGPGPGCAPWSPAGRDRGVHRGQTQLLVN